MAALTPILPPGLALSMPPFRLTNTTLRQV